MLMRCCWLQLYRGTCTAAAAGGKRKHRFGRRCCRRWGSKCWVTAGGILFLLLSSGLLWGLGHGPHSGLGLNHKCLHQQVLHSGGGEGTDGEPLLDGRGVEVGLLYKAESSAGVCESGSVKAMDVGDDVHFSVVYKWILVSDCKKQVVSMEVTRATSGVLYFVCLMVMQGCYVITMM